MAGRKTTNHTITFRKTTIARVAKLQGRPPGAKLSPLVDYLVQRGLEAIDREREIAKSA